MQLRLAGADCDAEHVRNFFVAVAVHRLQHDDVARARRAASRARAPRPSLRRRRIAGALRPARRRARRRPPRRPIPRACRDCAACVSTSLTAIRCSHVPKALRPSKAARLRQARMKVCCTQSSATSRRRVMRRHRPMTLPLCRRYRRSNARMSPFAGGRHQRAVRERRAIGASQCRAVGSGPGRSMSPRLLSRL